MISSSLVFVKGDSVPFHVAGAPDVVATALERGRDTATEYVRLDAVPRVEQPSRPLYLDPYSAHAVLGHDDEDED